MGGKIGGIQKREQTRITAKIGVGGNYIMGMEKRAKFDNAPTAQIAGNEIFTWEEPLDMKALRSKVVPWMRERGYFRKNYKNFDQGWDNYDHEFIDINNLDGLPSHAGATGKANRPRQGSIINIIQRTIGTINNLTSPQ